MTCKADFVVPEATLDRFALHIQFAFGDPDVRVENVEKTCEALIKAAWYLDFADEERVCLYRVSDMLHFAFTGSHVTLESVSVEGKISRVIPCNVPTRDAATWELLREDSTTSAARFEEASQLLRELYEHLPYTGADTPEEHFWLSHASSLLHECANLMRNGMTAT